MLTSLVITDFIEQKKEFHLLIDARSPKEFEESHIPNAYNYYALSNEEHHQVGTLYKQISRNDAKALGASYICANVARHIQTIYQNYKIGSKIGIYCAKGGMRSSSIALILSSIGYQVFKLDGGYKSYRNYVLSYLETFLHERFIVLGGNTGCGKTELLEHLYPAINLEKLANHMGSSFGSVKGVQPSQRAFENELCDNLSTLNPLETIFIEGESKRMGSVTIPSRLHEKMQLAPRVEVTAPLHDRIERILKDYQHIDSNLFYEAMQKITPYISKSAKERAMEAFNAHDLALVAHILLVEYYDKVYKKPKEILYSIDNTSLNHTLNYLKTLQVAF